MWIDFSPLKNNRDFRYLYFGQFVSFFGTMMSLVALPFQVYQLTQSTLMVGLLGIAELVPLLCTAFIGGALADVMDRKTLLIRAELGMMMGCIVLVINALIAHPQLWVIFIISAIMSALNGLHRPSLDALLPRLVKHKEIQSASILSTFKSTVGMIGGPAVAGICISRFGIAWTFALDLLTFLLSLLALMQIKSMPPKEQSGRPSLKSIMAAIRYATSRQELMGTYVIDFAAMVFAMPNALFPALAPIFGGSKILGWLYSAPAIGGLIVTVLSGWTKHITRHGAAVALAALCWGVAMVMVGLAPHIVWILIFLGLAGAADCVSGIFRTTLWNETIPDDIRGRMASLEMISYMSGPLLGNAQAGLMASFTGTQNAFVVGGTLCVLAVGISVIYLPRFWRYQSSSSRH